MTERVYFIQLGIDGPIKIGKAVRNGRISEIQGANPLAIRVLLQLPGGVELEQALHAKFNHIRIRGEWFAPESELTEYIAQQRADAGWNDEPDPLYEATKRHSPLTPFALDVIERARQTGTGPEWAMLYARLYDSLASVN